MLDETAVIAWQRKLSWYSQVIIRKESIWRDSNMSYMRGDTYIWHDGENLHLWSADGTDGWDQSVWYTGVTGKEPRDDRQGYVEVKASGVMLPESVLDEFVLMRLAEMLQQRKAREAVNRAISKLSGNGGCLALNMYAEQLEAIFADLEDNSSNET
jgi:hypothetical protein